MLAGVNDRGGCSEWGNGTNTGHADEEEGKSKTKRLMWEKYLNNKGAWTDGAEVV